MKKLALFIGLLFSIYLGYGQEECFPKKKDGVFVYDMGNVLSTSEETMLQSKLMAFTKRTSNVLVVVTSNDMCGTDISQFAIELGDQLGVGRKGIENGLVFVVKPKIGTAKGDVFIAVGTGLQGAITDAGTKRIIEYEIIPYFKQGSYIGGINAGAETLMRIAEGEFSEADYMEQTDVSWKIIFLVVLFIILILIAQKYGGGKNDDWENYDRHGKHRGGRRGGGIPWIIGGGGLGGSSGGGGFGGGFGGFGGGGFSGGGAGGSW